MGSIVYRIPEMGQIEIRSGLIYKHEDGKNYSFDICLPLNYNNTINYPTVLLINGGSNSSLALNEKFRSGFLSWGRLLAASGLLAIHFLWNYKRPEDIVDMIQSFSQNNSSEKKVFVYKKVNKHEIKANIFLPETKGLHPVFVFFHGWFFLGNRDQGLRDLLKEKLLASGYAVVSADFRLAPETKLSGMLEDVKDIIKWLREEGCHKYPVDTGRIVVSGCSAGGYLALTSGFNLNHAPHAIVTISAPTGFLSTKVAPVGDLSLLNQPGPYDIVQDSIVSYGDYDTRMNLMSFLSKNNLALYELFGFDPTKEPDKLKEYSLSDKIKSNYPPTLIVHAKNDRLVDIGQVEAFYDFLQKNEIKSELYLVENGHSNYLIDQSPSVVDKIIEFLNKQLKE